MDIRFISYRRGPGGYLAAEGPLRAELTVALLKRKPWRHMLECGCIPQKRS